MIIDKDWKVVLLLLILTAIFFWPVVTNPGKIIYTSHYSDVISHHSSYKFFITETWDSLGKIPLWNPYVYAGTPFVSNPQSAVFHPFTFLHMVSGSDSVFGYIFLLDVFLIGCFTYFFAKEIGITRFSALAAGIVFMFSGYVVVHTNAGHTSHMDILAFMPLAFLLVERIIKEEKVFYGLVLGIPLALQILAGHVQMAVYVSGALALYFLLRMFFVIRRKRSLRVAVRPTLLLFSAFLVAALLSAIQLLPMLELLGNVVRTEGDVPTSYSLPPWQLPSIMMPELFGTFLDDTYWGGRNFWELSLYVGMFPLILVALSLVSKGDTKSRMYRMIFLCMIVFSILYAFGNYFPIFDFVYYLPFFDMLRKPSIILFLSAFSLSMLSGFGLDILLRKPERRRIGALIKLLSLGMVLSLLILAVIHLQKDYVFLIADQMLEERYESFTEDVHQLKYGIEYYRQKIPGAYNHIIKSLTIFGVLLLSSILLLYVKAENIISQKRFKAFVVLVVILDLWVFGMKYIQVEDPANMLPPGTDRCQYEMWRTDEGEAGAYRVFDTLDLNSLAGTSDCFSQYLSMRYGAETIWGDDSTVLESYKRFTDSTMNLFGGSASSEVEFNPKILGMLNVRYVVMMEEVDVDGLVLDHIQLTHEYAGYLKTPTTKNVYIYENTEFLPRAFVVHDAKIVEGSAGSIAEILNDEFDPKEYVILHEDPSVELENLGEFEAAEVAYLSPHEFQVDVETTSPGFLVISQNWYPGWKAYDNAETKEIYRADYTLSAISIDSGSHDIRFVYEPGSLRVGAWITRISAISLCIFLLYYLKSGKPEMMGG